MLDIKFIRENKEIIKEGARKKQIIVDIDALIKLDDTRRELNMAIDQKRSEQNTFNDHITKVTDESERKMLIEKMKYLKDALQKDEEKMKAVMLKWKAMMLEVPNIPDMSVPEGVDESSNETALEWGNKPEFSFKPKDHVDLMVNLKMVDFERGAKAHGFRGYYLSGDGAELSWALWNYGRDFFGKKNFTPFIPPVIVRKEFFYGTGHLPRESEDLYKTGDDDYLSGTAEVPMMAYHSGEVLNENDLPRRYLAFSPCFMREAGSYGKDTKGIFRIHGFVKDGQVVLCEASHEESVKYHEELTANAEALLQELKLPYRVVINCGGDLGLGQVKKYDIEVWLPSEKQYRETH